MTVQPKPFIMKSSHAYLGLEETESDYLIVSRKERCRQILQAGDPTEENMIELYIALHVVLEVGLNALLRRLTLWHVGPGFDRVEVIKQVDEIHFKDKVAMFLYHGHFNFEDEAGQAIGHHRILNKIMHFSEIRNQLLHGHSISTLTLEGKKHQSAVRRKMNQETLAKQLALFQDIVKGMNFFLNHLVVDRPGLDKKELVDKYLNVDFLWP